MKKKYLCFRRSLLIAFFIIASFRAWAQNTATLSANCSASALTISGHLSTSNNNKVGILIYKDNNIVGVISDIPGSTFSQTAPLSGSGSYYVKVREVNNDANEINSATVAVNCSSTPPSDPPTNPNPPTNPSPPSGGGLAFQIVSYDCNSGILQYQFTGGNGSPVDVSLPGIFGGTMNANTVATYTFPGDARTGRTITGSATQSGQTIAINFTNGCSMSTTPITPPPPTTPTNPPATNPAAYSLSGNFDYANCQMFSGWVMNSNKSTKIDIYVNGWLVASNVPAIHPRPDVANAFGISDFTAFGFKVFLPMLYKRGVPLTISVKYARTDVDIPGSPKTTSVCEMPATDSDCGEVVARIFPGSAQARSGANARTGPNSVQLITKGSAGVGSLMSRFIPIKQGDNVSVGVYAFSPNVVKRNLSPQLTSAVVGGAVAAVALTQQATNPDQRQSVQMAPALGIGTGLMIPLIKSLLTKRLPNAGLELAFYDKLGKFIHRHQVKISKNALQEWQLLQIDGRAPQDGYVAIRLRNLSKVPVYFDDLFFQENPNGQADTLGAERSSPRIIHTKNGFASQAVLNEKSVYEASPFPDDNCGGYTYGYLINELYNVSAKIGFFLDAVNVTAPRPTYTYSNGTILKPAGGGSSGGSSSVANALVGPNLNDKFNQQLDKTKKHFCEQAAQVRSQYATPPNWSNPGENGDPQTGQVAALLRAFINDVKDGAPYDLKKHGYGDRDIEEYSNYSGGVLRYDDYGNINFGLAAAASGIPIQVALCGAGIYQWLPTSGPVDFSNLGGCFDMSQDSAMIQFGYQFFRGCNNPVQHGLDAR